jgi:hypothetical protein
MSLITSVPQGNRYVAEQTTDNKAYSTDRWHFRFSLGLKLMLGLGALLLLLSGQYQAAAETLIILYLTLMPMRLTARFSVRMPPEFDTLAIIFICMSLFLGEVLDFYNRYWWWDVVLHTGSGFLLGITGFVLVYVLNGNEKIEFDLSIGFIALFAFMFAMGMGAIWEIFEFTMDSLFGLNMQKSGLVDTMWDLIVDCIGALTISIMGYSFLRTTESDSFLERWIDRLIENNPAIFTKKHHNE